jgi:YVTN family beta-propeller protein
VIDCEALSVVKTIKTQAGPVALKLSESRKQLWVAQQAANSVAVVNLETQTVEESIPTGNGPMFLEILPDQSKLFVANANDESVSVIDTQTRKPLEPLSRGDRQQLVMKTDGGEIYANNFDDGSVVVINTSNCTLNGSFRGPQSYPRSHLARWTAPVCGQLRFEHGFSSDPEQPLCGCFHCRERTT